MVRFVRQASCLLLVLVTEPVFAQPTAQSACRLPPNLNTGVSQSTVELLWRASATFRERCRQQGATGSGVLPVEANDVGNDKDLYVTPRALLTTDPRGFVRWLETDRPVPLTAQARARVLSALPAEGEITRLNGSGRRKLAAATRLLQAAGRGTAFEIKVVDIPMSRVGLYERSVILISEKALTLLEADELQALVAHEIGHEYFTVDYERASGLKNKVRLKELELLCDAVAIVTLERLHIDPSGLMSGVEKAARYNRQHRGGAMDESGYPTLSERRTFAREVIAWSARGR